MFCINCGNQLADGERFCGYCGSAVQSAQTQTYYGQAIDSQPTQAQTTYSQPVYSQPAYSPPAYSQPVSGGPVGYSPRINDPAFAKYKGKSTTWSFLFAAILAVIAMVAFPIYGQASGDIKWPQSLYYGMGIGGMFLVIALLQTLKQGADHTWDGTVEFKNSYREVTREQDGHTHEEMVYILKVRKDAGGVKKHKWRNIPGPYDYYHVGDKVRHHKGFYYYEKFDKSKDSQIMCAACLSLNDMQNDVCARCKCPLLK